jgi:hypothetical protein
MGEFNRIVAISVMAVAGQAQARPIDSGEFVFGPLVFLADVSQ